MRKKNPVFFLTLIICTFLIEISSLRAFYVSTDVSEYNTSQLKTLSTITNLAQTAIWLNEEELAVGR